jgi:hypothetical protein
MSDIDTVDMEVNGNIRNIQYISILRHATTGEADFGFSVLAKAAPSESLSYTWVQYLRAGIATSLSMKVSGNSPINVP